LEEGLGYERSLITDPHVVCGEWTTLLVPFDRVFEVESFCMIRFGISVHLSNWEYFPELNELLPLDIHSGSADRTIGLLDRNGAGHVGIFADHIQNTMHILIGSDHAGIELKHHLKDRLRAAGHSITDKGTHVKESVDYPDHAHAVAEAVKAEEGSFGILICGSGNGVNIAANRHTGIRSALAWTPELATLARQHNNANILALPARFITMEMADAIVDSFLTGEYEGGRHQRRVQKIEIEH
jgi:ribose 5-phosphate isomerase B